jgi:Carboxypeptidase regulatory-like domain
MNRSVLAGLACILMATAGCGGKGTAATAPPTTTEAATVAAPTTSSTSTTTSTAATTTTSTTGRSTTTTMPPTTVAPPPPSGTGVYGVVTASPTCPVQRVDQPCPPEPLSVQLNADDSAGHTVATTHTDDAGHYRLSLAPGSYILVVQTSGMFPRCPATPVTVPAGSAVRQDINCDTGIR